MSHGQRAPSLRFNVQETSPLMKTLSPNPGSCFVSVHLMADNTKYDSMIKLTFPFIQCVILTPFLDICRKHQLAPVSKDRYSTPWRKRLQTKSPRPQYSHEWVECSAILKSAWLSSRDYPYKKQAPLCIFQWNFSRVTKVQETCAVTAD